MRSSLSASFAIYALLALSMWTPTGEGPFAAAAELAKYALFLGASASIVFIAYRARGFTISLSGDWLLLIAFLIYTSLSFLWSDGTVNALIKAMLIFTAMTVAISMANLKRMDELLHIFYRIKCVFLILSLLAVIFFPAMAIETGWGLEGDWRGIAGQKNGLGHVAASALIASLVLPLRAAPRGYFSRAGLMRLSMLLIAVICLINSGSRGAMMIAAIGLGAVALSRAPKILQRVTLVMFVVFAIPLVNLTLPTLGLRADQIEILGAQIDTSNRTTIWFYGFEQLAGRELLGFGVNGFWTPQRMTAFRDIYGWVLDDFHNGYITILMEGGLVGLTLLLMALAFIMLLYMIAVGNVRDPYLSLAFAYFNMTLFSNLVENGIGRSTSSTFIIFLTLSFALRGYLARFAPVRPASAQPAAGYS